MNDLLRIIEIAETFGLYKQDITNAKDYLQQNELELSFDTIITQLYEYEIKIDEDFYDLVVKVAEKMKLKRESYFFITELINSNN